MKRRIFVGLAALVVILVGVFAVLVIVMAPQVREQEKVRAMPINEVELSRVSNGSYKGNFTYGKFTYEVEVLVKDHRVESIDILVNREGSKHAKKAEGVVERVLEAQSLQVDAVTEATTTSKAFLKAIENALSKGISE